MNSQSVFTKSFKTGMFFATALFFVIGTVYAGRYENGHKQER